MHNDDALLVERFRTTGDTEAYAGIVRRYAGLVYSACQRITHERTRAEDASQETFLHLLRKSNSVKGSLASWLYTTAAWKAIDLVRQDEARKERESRHGGKVAMDGASWDDISPHIDRAMLELPEHERTILVEHLLNGRSQNELATAEGVSQPTISRRIDGALSKLRAGLAGRDVFAGLTVLPVLLSRHMVQPAPPELVRELCKLALLAGARSAATGTLKTGLHFLLKGATRKLIAIGFLIALIASFIGSPVHRFWSGRHVPRFGKPVPSTHFFMQSPYAGPGIGAVLGFWSQGPYEAWYCFPEGRDGPLYYRLQRWNVQVTIKHGQWLQNDRGCYLFHAPKHIIYICNTCQWWTDFQVRRLPTDPPAFTEFLDRMEGMGGKVQYVRDEKTGYVTSAIDDRYGEPSRYENDVQYGELAAGFFNYNWPKYLRVIDLRDALHKRGWTYFRLTGRIGGRNVQGVGRVPLVYCHYDAHSPWLRLSVENSLRFTDGLEGSLIQDQAGTLLAHYPAGAFFKGLLRPWVGLHTIDLIRRDAAEKSIPFTTTPNEKNDRVAITLARGPVTLTYDVNLKKDLINSITITKDGNEVSRIVFSYPERLDPAEKNVPDELPAAAAKAKVNESMGISWLFRLADEGNNGPLAHYK